MTRNQSTDNTLVPKLQLGNAGLEAPASHAVSRSWSFAYWVPKLELGNQHNQHSFVGAGRARDEAATILPSPRPLRGRGPLLQRMTCPL